MKKTLIGLSAVLGAAILAAVVLRRKPGRYVPPRAI